MKKYLLTILVGMLVVFTGYAQNSSGNKVVDGILEETDCSEIEEMLAEAGIKAHIRIYFDSERNLLVFSYKLYDQKVYDVWDVEESLNGAIKGMINATIEQDDTGNFVVWIGNEFKRTNTGVSVEILYKNKKKSASATADEIIEIVYNMFQ